MFDVKKEEEEEAKAPVRLCPKRKCREEGEERKNRFFAKTTILAPLSSSPLILILISIPRFPLPKRIGVATTRIKEERGEEKMKSDKEED